MLQQRIHDIWRRYTKLHRITLGASAFLFAFQIVHLAWLTGDIVLPKLIGQSFWPTSSALSASLLALVDYTEIPAIISTSLLYIASYRNSGRKKDLLYLCLINIQWIHLIWITDEVVVGSLAGVHLHWPIYLAVIAIGIDYLELPVIYETCKRFYIEMRGSRNTRNQTL